VVLIGSLFVWACTDEQEPFELNARRIAELARATCSCSDSVSVEACARPYEASLNASLLPQIEAGRVRVEGSHWADCIAERAACSPTARACDELFAGAVEKGKACDVSSAECAAGLRCVVEDPDAKSCAIVGTCRAIEMFEHDERCEPSGRCEDERDICGVATSGEDEGEMICRRPLREGAACPLAELGAAGSQLCERGTACAPDRRVDRDEDAGEEAAAGDSEDDSEDDSEATAEIVCRGPLDEGEPCFFQVGEVAGVGLCRSGTFCDSAIGVCARFPFPEGNELGEACESTRDCQPGLACIDDECAHLLLNGSECEQDAQCAALCFKGECASSIVACKLQ